MQTEQLRMCLLSYLKEYLENPRRDVLQYQHCLHGVGHVAARLGLPGLRENRLSDEDGGRLKHVIWDLVIERILIPGTAHSGTLDNGWPFLTITDHGKKVIAAQGPVPYDPDGYISRLKQLQGGLHLTVETYLAEAISTFRTGNNLAASVMLGAAAEWLMLQLCDAIRDAFAVANERAAFERSVDPKRKMVERIAAVMQWLSDRAPQLPADWRGKRHRLIENIADLIRYRRNDAGHPQDPPVRRSHEEIYALMILFSDYCEKVTVLRFWLEANAGKIT